MTDLSIFRFSYPIDVRYADLDVLQHVNNAKYFTYMETARIHYLSDIVGWPGNLSALGVIIARAACEYKLPLVFGDKAQVYVRTSRLGTKSFDLEYLIVREGDNAITAVGSTVQVAYDYQQQVSVSVPEAWRKAVTDYEPALNP